MNRITIEFCEEDRKRIDELIAVGIMLTGALKEGIAKTEPIPVTFEVPTTEPPAADPVEEIPAPVVEAPTTEAATLAEFQKAVTLAVSKSAEAKKAVKALINKYAASVSAVPEDKRAEVMAELAKV